MFKTYAKHLIKEASKSTEINPHIFKNCPLHDPSNIHTYIPYERSIKNKRAEVIERDIKKTHKNHLFLQCFVDVTTFRLVPNRINNATKHDHDITTNGGKYDPRRNPYDRKWTNEETPK